MYYNYSKILSYNAPLNILIGERGVGKTFGAIKFCIKQFLKNKSQFVYLRRYKTELSSALSSFFDEIKNLDEFKNVDFSVKNNNFYINGELAGYGMTLTQAQNMKSKNFANVFYLIFDEFIIEEGQKKYYLHNEVFIFLNLLETIFRLRKMKVFLLGNAGNITSNPYFLFFDLHLPYNSDIITFKNGMILLQFMKNEEYRKIKAKSDIGKLISNTIVEDYIILNKDININNNFIGKKSKSAKFSFAFKYNGSIFGVWIDNINGLLFISSDYIKNTPYIFACTLDDFSENTLLFNNIKNYTFWKTLINAFQIGAIRYENQKIKSLCLSLFKRILC